MIRNTFTQGTLSIVFAVLVPIVVGVGIILAIKVIRGRTRPLSEDETLPSRLFAPWGTVRPPPKERVQKKWDALTNSAAKSIGSEAH
ncbi:hypothetical protein BH09ACT8_BH09ACT8_40020 [soil metagenome]